MEEIDERRTTRHNNLVVVIITVGVKSIFQKVDS
jgi:hypothetical protein